MERHGSITDEELNVSINKLRGRAGVASLTNKQVTDHQLDMPVSYTHLLAARIFYVILFVLIVAGFIYALNRRNHRKMVRMQQDVYKRQSLHSPSLPGSMEKRGTVLLSLFMNQVRGKSLRLFSQSLTLMRKSPA